jgi:cytochrome P450
MEVETRALARDFVQQLVIAGTGDLQAGLSVPFPIAVIAALLGVDPDRRADFRRWSEQMVIAVFEPDSAHEQDEITRSNEQMGEWIEGVIAERTGRLGDDLVSVLLRAELEGGALSAEELRVFVITLLVAGSITTAYLIGSVAIALSRDPALQARARTEPGFVARIVDESLRHDTPVQMMFRTATEEVEIAGVTIPPGATVVPLIGSANRDERVFPDPDRFDPGRDTSEHLSFGHGVHFCLGAALAKLEARIAIEELLAVAPRLELAGEAETVTSLVFRGPTRLPLRYA